MHRILFLILCGWIISCSTQPETQQTQAEEDPQPSLQQLWVSDTLLRTPESVLYDQERDLIYVANVNMNPWEKDGNGFISKLDTEGNIVELEWITGLSGPKGMGIKGNSLFVADIDEVVEIDIESAQITQRYKVEGTPTLNDITVYDEVVYVSGSDSNKLFELKDGEIQVILEGELGRPNGLYAEADRLLMITSNSSQLIAIDKASLDQKVLVDSIGHGDGIVPAGNGDYFASSWRGEVFYISPEMERIQLLDTREAEINSADIAYIVEKELLLVPTFFKNQVVAYQWVK